VPVAKTVFLSYTKVIQMFRTYNSKLMAILLCLFLFGTNAISQTSYTPHLKKADWQTGFFQTLDERKLYFYKPRFDSEPAETKKMSFIMRANNCPKRNYSIQVYHKGLIVAKRNKKLS
jgi:hypothetical protein